MPMSAIRNMDETGFRIGCEIAHWVLSIDAEK